MKKLIFTLLTALTLVVSGCKYDDSDLWNSVNGLEERVTTLEKLCNQINTNVNSLQTIVNALQDNDYVTGVTPLYEGGNMIGYTISFTKSPTITIYHGKDGKDGLNGQDGTNGKDGQDGYTPLIGVKLHSDGHYYWTLDGEWLLDDNGNKILAEGTPGKDGLNGQDGTNGRDGQDGKDGQDGQDGKDGITPQFKITDGCWWISYDDGQTWQNLGQATGDKGANGKDGLDGKDGQNGVDGKDGKDGQDGRDGDSMFRSVDTSDPDFVIFTLADGTQIKLPTWYAFEELKKLCNQMNTNILSLQTIVEAMQAGDYIVSCTPLIEDGKQIGHTITFAKSGSIVIYHGKDGANGSDGTNGSDGKDGQNGKDGTDGKDGHSPVIGVKEYQGVLYWTLDGEWLLDDNGQKIPVTGKDGQDGTNGSNGQNGADGKDGFTPQFKIEDGCWWISYDDGQNWQNIGQATGDKGADGKDGQNGTNGKDGESMFSNVDNSDPDYVILTMNDGTEIKIPRSSNLAITFLEDVSSMAMRPNSTKSISYTITGNTKNLQVEVLSSGNVRAKISNTTDANGTITVTTGSKIDEYDKVVILASNGERTIMKSIIFDEAGLRVTNDLSYSVPAEGQTIQINIETNCNYKVVIPDEAQSWISQAPLSRAWRNETITLTVKPNELYGRHTNIELVDEDGDSWQNIFIYQNAGGIPTDMTKAFPWEAFRSYILKNFDSNKDNRISLDEANLVTELNLSNLGTSTNRGSLEGIQYFTNLERLTIKDGNYPPRITDEVDLSQNINLTYLDVNIVSGGGINDLSQNKKLQSVKILHSAGSNFKLPETESLTYLSIQFCRLIKQLDISKNPKLEEVTIANCTNLTSLDVTHNPAIKKLIVGNNGLGYLDLTKSTELQILNTESCPISSLDLSQNTKLAELRCLGCKLTSLDLSHNPLLNSLICNNNYIVDLNVSNNPVLEYLLCQNNLITVLDLSNTNLGNSSREHPLNCSDMPSLKTLYLKKGWEINGVTGDSRTIDYVAAGASIEYK